MDIDTRKASNNPIPDGIYFIHPDGCGWSACEFSGGEVIGGCDQSEAGTHAAARDAWAGVAPSESDELLDIADEQLSIDIALAAGYDDAYGVAISRPAKN